MIEAMSDMRSLFFKALVAMLVVCLIAACYNVYTVKTERDNAEMAIAAGYTVYLDGEEVDPDTVDLNYYRIKVNDYTQSVLLTKPVEHNHVMPVPVTVVH